MDGEGLAGGAALRRNLPCGRAISACGPLCASGKKPSPAAERTTSSAFNRGGLAREEIERSIDKELFDDLEYKIIAKPLIPKLRRSYTLPDGSVLEVNHVDEGQPTEFWYAEVEYPHGGSSPCMAAGKLRPWRLPQG